MTEMSITQCIVLLGTPDAKRINMYNYACIIALTIFAYQQNAVMMYVYFILFIGMECVR